MAIIKSMLAIRRFACQDETLLFTPIVGVRQRSFDSISTKPYWESRVNEMFRNSIPIRVFLFHSFDDGTRHSLPHTQYHPIIKQKQPLSARWNHRFLLQEWLPLDSVRRIWSKNIQYSAKFDSRSKPTERSNNECLRCFTCKEKGMLFLTKESRTPFNSTRLYLHVLGQFPDVRFQVIRQLRDWSISMSKEVQTSSSQ